MKKQLTAFLALACILAGASAPAADKKDKTLIDLKKIEADNVVANARHTAMGALGDRVHGGEFGPWRCQVKVLDRREMNAKMKSSEKIDRIPTSHLVSISIMDPSTGKGMTEGAGTVTVTGPGGFKTHSEMIQMSGPYLADIALPKAGDYDFQIDFALGKRKASAKFRYSVK